MQLISEYLSYRASNPIGLQSHIRTAMTLVDYPCKEQKEPEPSTSLVKETDVFFVLVRKIKKLVKNATNVIYLFVMSTRIKRFTVQIAN